MEFSLFKNVARHTFKHPFDNSSVDIVMYDCFRQQFIQMKYPNWLVRDSFIESLFFDLFTADCEIDLLPLLIQSNLLKRI